jgi:UDP-N-acetylglucosamine acyltransferase
MVSNKVHPTAIVGPDVQLGQGNEIGAYCVIYGPTVIGDNNIIGPHVVIGTPGQDTRNPRYDSSLCRIKIGNENIIREFVAIQKPCYSDITEIGDRVHIMQGVHVPHDACIHDDVVLTPMVALGGISTVLRGANIALGVTVHQYSVIGHYSIVGMGATVLKNIRPFSRFIPGRLPSVNYYALDKFGYEAEREEIEAYVLNGVDPHSPRLLSIVDEFQRLSEIKGRPVY